MRVDLSDFELRHAVPPEQLPQLMALFAGEWWTAERDAADVARMLDASDLVFAMVCRPAERLAAFTRVLTDDTYLAVILDVIVAEEYRGLGLGAALLNAVVGHPRLARVRSVELVCQPGLIEFYRRFGFTDEVGGSRLIRRSSDRLLVKRYV
jgi:GNAT superfamily N-acetyltransferase